MNVRDEVPPPLKSIFITQKSIFITQKSICITQKSICITQKSIFVMRMDGNIHRFLIVY